MSAPTRTIEVEQYASWGESYQLKDSSGTGINITGASLKMTIARPDGTALHTLTVGSGITVTSASTGAFSAVLTKAQTGALSGPAIYDLIIEYSGGTVQRLMQGPVSVVPGLSSL